MDVVEAIRKRKSIRGYKPDPVPPETLSEILEIATRAPSGMNTQPWEITVVTGKALDSIRQGNLEMLKSTANQGAPARAFEGKYRQRQIEIAVQLFTVMGIAEEDREKRAWWMQKGFRYFEAPAVFILSVDKSVIASMAAFAIGALAQTICLAALNYGLGTCIEDQGIRFLEVLKKFTGIPESHQPVIAIAIGYPDPDFPANKVESTREPLEKVVTWCDE